MKHFAAWCGQEEGNFSGSWDLGHQLQIAYGNVMKESETIRDFNKTMYRIMSEHKSHQSGVRFKEIGDELQYCLLTNKGAQETRWVRAELRSVQTYLRNLPALGIIYGREVEECARTFDARGQKEAERHLEDIRNPETIALAVGICQILESYAQVSLDGQSLSTSPSTVPSIIKNLKDTLRTSAEKWEWQTESLKLSQIGVPLELFQQLKDGEYKPHLTDNMKLCAAKRLNASRQHENKMQEIFAAQEDEDIYTVREDIPVDEVSAGTLPVEGFDAGRCASVESKLSDIAETIWNQLEDNVQIPDYLTEGYR